MAVGDQFGTPFTVPLAGSSPSASAGAAASGLSAEAPAGVLRTSPGGEKSGASKPRGVLGRMSSSVNFSSQTSQQVSSTHLHQHLLRALLHIHHLRTVRVQYSCTRMRVLRYACAREKLRCGGAGVLFYLLGSRSAPSSGDAFTGKRVR